MFLRYAVCQEALIKDESIELIKDTWKTLNQVADELAQVADTEETTERFFEASRSCRLRGLPCDYGGCNS